MMMKKMTQTAQELLKSRTAFFKTCMVHYSVLASVLGIIVYILYSLYILALDISRHSSQIL